MEAPDATPICELRNLGPASATLLGEIGIMTRGDLERVGPVLAFRALRHLRPGVSLNLLWAMQGALTGERWDRLSKGTRDRLTRDVAEAADVPPLVERPSR